MTEDAKAAGKHAERQHRESMAGERARAAGARQAETDDLLNYAWTIICNAELSLSNGAETREWAEWQGAMSRFRTKYHAHLDAYGVPFEQREAT